jgi:5-methyltetrahydrofolate corrinoid/iron sulfur protein methyltransferase
LILVADNLQITNTTIQKAVGEMNPIPIQELVKKCEAAGADAIDINSGPLPGDFKKQMSFLVETVQEITNLPILIDTANPAALEAGLNANKKTAIINGFSLEPSKIEAILPLSKKFDVDIIAYLLYPNSHVPPDASERMNIAVELYKVFQKTGSDREHLIIDPVIVPLTWQNGNFQADEILSVITHLPDLLGFAVQTIAGISNLTTGKGNRDNKRLMERVYLPMLAASGLSMALLNIFHKETVRTAKACSSITSEKVFVWDEL